MSTVSIIIPARNEPYLISTINDVFNKASGDIEVIVILDGYKANIGKRSNLCIIYHDKPTGTRKSINEAARIASGEYLFKLDAHCMLSDGFDTVLKRDHQPNWVVTLPRYSLLPDSWTRGYGPICYEYIAYPIGSKYLGGLTPNKWYGPDGLSKERNKPIYFWLERQREHILIDEIQTCNAACWFITKKMYNDIGGLDERLWSFHIDGVEIGFKAWLSGGALMINKNGWHAHWFKSEHKRTVSLKWNIMHNTQAYSTWYWFNNQWPKQTRSFAWFINHFWPIPGWPDNWEEELSKIPEPQLISEDA